ARRVSAIDRNDNAGAWQNTVRIGGPHVDRGRFAMTNLFDELQWRGLVYDATEGLREILEAERVTAYVGFDPTASSLHIGHLLHLTRLGRLQRGGHKPIAIAGGGTGMIGDPSGKSQERALLTHEQMESNLAGIKPQLAKLFDFDSRDNPARVVNNYDWLG